MAMENLIGMQSTGLRSIGEPTAPRPTGVVQGSVLVVLDVNKAVAPGALYWTLANIVRKGDNLKILGIITHIVNAIGFMMRVEQNAWSGPSIMELQKEIATKKEAIWRTVHVKEWCERAGVKLDVDVKAGNNPKVIAIDEAKSIGAYHVVLDKNMKKDRKYFVDNLACFVSRFTSGGGVDTIRSFAVNSNKLPPIVRTTPKPSSSQAPGHRSKSSIGSNASYRGASSMSSTSFELGGDSSDDFSAQEGDPLSLPSTGDSMDLPMPSHLPAGVNGLTIRTAPPELILPLQHHANLYNLLRGPVLELGDNGPFNNNVGFNNLLNNTNPLRKGPAVRTRPNDDEGRISVSDQGPLTPRTEFRIAQLPAATRRGGPRFHHHNTASNNTGSANNWIGKLNVAPELGHKTMGRHALAATLRTQASFNSKRAGKQYAFRAYTISMDMHWPLMHWADCRAMRLRASHGTSSSTTTLSSLSLLSGSGGSLSSFRNPVRRRMPVAGLNYNDMVESD